uniref:Uncharacterized protein n=1 Tax=Cyprinus carpio TaxID=7962 RepID=A0A8C1M8L2_CYPCA
MQFMSFSVGVYGCQDIKFFLICCFKDSLPVNLPLSFFILIYAPGLPEILRFLLQAWFCWICLLDLSSTGLWPSKPAHLLVSGDFSLLPLSLLRFSRDDDGVYIKITWRVRVLWGNSH